MSLQFILGNSGSGKSSAALKQLVEEAHKNPKQNYFVIVPEQFTLSTQKELVSLSYGKAIMNMDVMSFKRMAYRVFDELGRKNPVVLEETGKNLVMRRVAAEHEKELRIIGPNMKRLGYVDEVKSLVSELMQYNVTPRDLEDYLDRKPGLSPSFEAKMRDVCLLYRGFQDYMRGSYITAEEILQELIPLAESSGLLAGATLVFDDFTGFTPVQNQLMGRLLKTAAQIRVILTIDAGEALTPLRNEHELFAMTKETMRTLAGLAAEAGVGIDPPRILGNAGSRRFAGSAELAHLEANLFRDRPGCFPGETDRISLHQMDSQRDELEYAAREIRRLVRKEGCRYRDIALLSGAAEQYGNLLPEIFGKYDIPYYLDRTTDLLFHPFTECLRAALEILENEFSYESVMRFLKTGFLTEDLESLDMLDNYLTATGIRGKKAWSRKWIRMPRQEGYYDPEKLNEMRKCLYDLFVPLFALFEGKNPVGEEILNALISFMEALSLEEKLNAMSERFLQKGDQILSQEYGQIYGIILDLLEKYRGLLGDEALDLGEFAELLEAGLSAAKVSSIPPGYDAVTVGDIERTRIGQVRCLFFTGVNDGIIPKAASGGGVISDHERELLAEDFTLAPGAREQVFTQRFYLYRNLTRPSDRLYVSYSLCDSERKASRPSYLIGLLEKLFPSMSPAVHEDMKAEACPAGPEPALDYLVYGREDRLWYALAKLMEERAPEETGKLLQAPYTVLAREPISRAVAEAIYGRRPGGSVTRLERFAACAYAHFLTFGLRLKERESRTLSGIDIGDIYHRALELYGSELKEKGIPWHGISEQVRTDTSRRAYSQALEENQILLASASGGEAYRLKRMGEIFEETIDILTRQIEKGNFEPEAFELNFKELHGGRGMAVPIGRSGEMELYGSVDRIDLCHHDGELLLKVIDYKSGSKDFDLNLIREGLSIQLPLYLEAAGEYVREKTGKTAGPAALLYYIIDDPLMEEGYDEEARLKSLRPKGVVNSDRKIYEQIDGDFEKDSPVMPVSLKADGNFAKTSHILSTDCFDLLTSYVKGKAKQEAAEIMRGKIAPEPFESPVDACAYCGYRGICGADSGLPGIRKRRAEKLEQEEVLEQMEKEVALWAGQKNRKM